MGVTRDLSGPIVSLLIGLLYLLSGKSSVSVSRHDSSSVRGTYFSGGQAGTELLKFEPQNEGVIATVFI